ncbi:uronyl 2-sulfotransferase-like [Ptychodera flava]|uniref:uronyl 2-sulfotransferase-like n=1 Tax=Ptychodera flava TaxID=63121 RepID=UPI00396A6878
MMRCNCLCRKHRLHTILFLLILLPFLVGVGILLRSHNGIDLSHVHGNEKREGTRRDLKPWGNLERGNEGDVVSASDVQFAKQWEKSQETEANVKAGDVTKRPDKKESKSLDDLLALPPDVDDSLVVYNRVPKCGSRSVLWIVRKNAKKFGFKYKHSMEFWKFRQNEKDQEKTVREIVNLPRPALFDMHVHFLNFTKFGELRPVYFNIIRDPISRLVSSYYFNRFGDSINKYMVSKFKGTDEERNQTFDECVLLNKTECQLGRAFYIVPFFCGQDARCREPSQWTLREAIRNALNEYVFVGILEEMNASMKILEVLLPRYFQGASKYLEYLETQGAQQNMHAIKKSEAPPSEKVVEIMKKRLAIEYEFYNTIRDRFSVIKEQLGIS